MKPRQIRLLFASAGLMLGAATATGAAAQVRHFEIPAEPARSAIVEFGRQAKVQILAPADVVAEITTRAVRGDLDARLALTELLKGTGLQVLSDDGHVIILGKTPATVADSTAPTKVALRTEAKPRLIMAAAEPLVEAGPSPELAEVVVTASRAAQTGFAASTPTTVISAETLTRQGVTNVGQIAFSHPAFKATVSPSGNDVRTATPGQSQAELRGLGGQRTLVLVNGMRMVPEAPATNTSVPVTTDLNTIPAMMIERMEVITGGASAQWGSDAVAGVVNIILKNKFQGFQATAQYGQAEVGDYKHGKVGAIAGTAFGEGRGHIVGAVEYERNPGLGDYTTRDYLKNNWQIIANTARASNSGEAFLRLPNVVSALGVSGLITGPANFSLRNFAFTDDGGKGVRPFNVGSLVSGVEQVGGEGPAPFKGIYLIPGFKRVASYARASYELSPNLTATAEFSYAWTKGWMNGSIPRLSAITIQKDNAYLPATVVNAMTAAGITSFTMNRYNTDIGNSFNQVSNKTPRGALGLEGRLGGDWSWDAHAALGRNIYDQSVANSGVAGRYVFAEDAVVNPANGQIVCRAVLAGNPAASGCVPINLFGSGSPSTEAKGYVSQTALAHVTYTQRNATFNLRGKPFSTWAGPISIGTGLEYRYERQVTAVSDLAQAGQFISLGNATGFRGSFSTKEIYLDTITPLARDLSFAKAIDLTAAIRYSDYSSIGGQTTWKVGGVYEIIDGLRFRVTESKDIRAPAIYELFGGGQLITTSVSVRGQSVNIPQNFTGGNPNLKAESSKTFTAGGVFEPRAVPGLRMSLDYYDIKITDAITNLISQNIANLCTQGSALFCGLFTFNAAGVPTSLNAPAQNLSEVRTNGYDFAVSYNRGMGGVMGLPSDASLSLSALGSYVTHAWIDSQAIGGSRVDRAGENTEINTGSVPHLRMNFSESLDLGRLTVTAQQLFVSKGKIDNTYNTAPALTINDNGIPSVWYASLFANFDLTKHVQLFGAVDNLFDKAPPQAPYPVFPVPGINGQYYDKVGRAYRVGVTYTF